MIDQQAPFGARLRSAREARGTTLRQIADATKLAVRTLEALERGKMAHLPGGIYRRSIVRSYAREIGLDPESTLREFLSEYPDDLPPLPGVPVPLAGTAEPKKPSGSWWQLMFRLSGVLVMCVTALSRGAFFDR